MKKLLLLANQKTKRTDYLFDILKDDYDILMCDNISETEKELDQSFQDLSALIVDNPSNIKDISNLIQHLDKKNSYMLSVPCIILTDDENAKEDEKYLDDTAVSIIKDCESKHVILQRLKKSSTFINSVSFQEFSEMLKALPSLIYLKDKEGRYVFCSQYLHHLDNYDDPDWTIRGKTDLDIRKDKENALKAMESDKKIIESGLGTSYIICESDSGEDEYLQLIKEPVKNKTTGEVRGIIAIINNVTEQERLRRELRKKSITDVLTNLYNRVYFEEYAKENMTKDSLYPISIISADCDGLKRINDEFGHALGDEYICMTASLLRDTLPKGTPIFRMGGDEFLAIIPNTGYEEARKILKALNVNMSNYHNRYFTLQVSCGLHTMMSQDEESIDMCVNKSDQEMYRIKRRRKQKRKHNKN